MISSYIFISYSSRNAAFVDSLHEELQQAGIAFYLDKFGLRTGMPDWEKALRTAISGSAGLILVASPDSYSSPYVRDELAIARDQGKPIYPIWADGEKWHECVPMGYGSIQYADARGTNYAGGVAKLIEGLQVGRTPEWVKSIDVQEYIPARTSAEPRNPYKGLRAFHLKDKNDFFGRANLIDELVDGLEHFPSFLAIIGPSGSGKSSVIMAGLLPRLHEGSLAGSASWVYLPPIVPGTHPLTSLSEALATALPQKTTFMIIDELQHPSGRGLYTLSRQITGLEASRRVVLYIDQFEELFTLTADENEREQFINLLLAAANEPESVLTILLSLRADFSDRPMAYAELGNLLENHRKAILPMTLADLYDAIQHPAALPEVGLEFEDGLVTELVFAVRDEIGGLPLLQFTLDQLFERRQGRYLTRAAYNDLGGLKGALAKHAEDTFASLPSDAHRMLAQSLFLRLVEPGATEQDTTRRRAALSELILTDPTQNDQMRAVADTFIAARLLLTNRIEEVETIEVAHEALIREWKRLEDWLYTARDDIRLHKTIYANANAWIERGAKTDDDGLYRGSVLQDALAWTARNVPSAKELQFLRVAVEQQARHERQEQERSEREAKLLQQARNRSRFAIGLAVPYTVLLMITLIIGVVSVVSRYQIVVNLFSMGDLKLNDIAPRDISAPIDLTYFSDPLTERAREIARQSVEDIYFPPDPNISRQQVMLTQQILTDIDNIRRNPDLTLEQKMNDLRTITALTLDDEIANRISTLNEATWADVSEEITLVLQSAMYGSIRQSDLNDGIAQLLPADVNVHFSPDEVDVIVAVLEDLVRPNTFLNEAATAQAREAAAANIQESHTFVRGQIIVREGELIDEVTYEALQKFNLLGSSPPLSIREQPGDLRYVFVTSYLLIIVILSIPLLLSRRLFQETIVPKYLVEVGCYALLGFLFGLALVETYHRPTLSSSVQVGDIVSSDIRAPISLSYQSTILTEQLRQQARENVASVYDPPDPNIARQQSLLARQILDHIDNIRQDPYPTVEQKLNDLRAITALTLDDEIANRILTLDEATWTDVSEQIQSVLAQVMRGQIRASDLNTVIAELPNQVSVRFNEDESSVIVAVVEDLIRPNSLADRTTTSQAQDAAAAAIPPQSRQFAAGQIVTRAGQTITSADFEALQRLGLIAAPGDTYDSASVHLFIFAASAISALVTAFVWRIIRISAFRWRYLLTAEAIFTIGFVASRFLMSQV